MIYREMMVLIFYPFGVICLNLLVVACPRCEICQRQLKYQIPLKNARESFNDGRGKISSERRPVRDRSVSALSEPAPGRLREF